MQPWTVPLSRIANKQKTATGNSRRGNPRAIKKLWRDPSRVKLRIMTTAAAGRLQSDSTWIWTSRSS